MGLIGRRKILRLYWLAHCDSIARKMISYHRTAIVETQNLASHEGGTHLSSAYYSVVRVGDGLIGRRKILRLYWLAHCGFIEGEMMTCR